MTIDDWNEPGETVVGGFTLTVAPGSDVHSWTVAYGGEVHVVGCSSTPSGSAKEAWLGAIDAALDCKKNWALDTLWSLAGLEKELRAANLQVVATQVGGSVWVPGRGATP